MINFPDAPNMNQTHSAAGTMWRWDGFKWGPSDTSPPIYEAEYITGIVAGAGLIGGGDVGDVVIGLEIPVTIARGGTGSTTGPLALDALSGSSGTQTGALTRAVNGSWLLSIAKEGTSRTVTDDVPPPSPIDGDLWWDSISAQLYIRYDDGTSQQWVLASSAEPGPMGPQGPPGVPGIPLPVVIASGGTGATTASTALSNLGGAPLLSPAFTGFPTAPTPSPQDSSSRLATTLFVKTVAGAYLPLTSGTLSAGLTVINSAYNSGFLAYSGNYGPWVVMFDDGNGHIESSTQLWLNGNTGQPVVCGGNLTCPGNMRAGDYYSRGVLSLDQSGGYVHLFGGDGTIAIHASSDNFYDANTHHFRRKGDNYESVLFYTSRLYDPVLLQVPYANNCRIIYLTQSVRQWSLGGEGGGNFSLWDDSGGTWRWFVNTSGTFTVNGNITTGNTVTGGYVLSTGDIHSNGNTTSGQGVYANYLYSYGDGQINGNITINGTSRSGWVVGTQSVQSLWDLHCHHGVVYDVLRGDVSTGFAPGDYLDIYLNQGYWYSVGNAFSDERAKCNFAAPEADALAVLKQLTLNAFDHLNDNRPRYEIGLVAQRVQELIPEAVFAGPTEAAEGVTIPIPGMLHLDFNPLMAYAFRAIQQLVDKVEALEKKLS